VLFLFLLFLLRPLLLLLPLVILLQLWPHRRLACRAYWGASSVRSARTCSALPLLPQQDLLLLLLLLLLLIAVI
jgi:hypothetical protein